MAKILDCLGRQLLTRCPKLHNTPYITAASFPAHMRCYSQYAPMYKEPFRPRGDNAAMLETEAFKEVQHLPVKAALNYYSNSMFLDPQLMKFVNHVMDGGRKELARRIINMAFRRVKMAQLEKYHAADPDERDNIELDPVKIFHKAVENARPLLRTTRIRLGATWYQVPRPVTVERATSTAMKWIIEVANDKPQTTRFHYSLATELVNTANNTGRVVQKKIELHKLCEANKAYAHFRWG